MSNYIEVIAIVEGKTEQIFIESILAPYILDDQVFVNLPNFGVGKNF